ncbi:MAG: replication initiation factor domain-containing protein [Planctomycetota bacterium]
MTNDTNPDPRPTAMQGSERLAAGTASSADWTQLGNTGSKFTNGVCLDWLSMTGPACSFSAAYDLLQGQFGEPDPTARMKFYGKCWAFNRNATLGSGHHGGAETIRVELTGTALAQLYEQSENVFEDPAINFLGALVGLGFVGTRIDIALDFFGTHPRLCENVRDAAANGCLVGLKSSDPREPRDGEGNVTGRTVYLGSRQTGRYVRCYDKGLKENGSASKPGEWVRWEVQFEKDCAAQLGRELYDADDWTEAATSAALGAVDFRTDTGDKNVSRRPRLGFWQAVLGDTTPRRITCQNQPSDLAGFLSWCRKTVAPTILAVMDKGGIEPDVLFMDIIRGAETTPATFKRPAVQQWIDRHEGGPTNAA